MKGVYFDPTTGECHKLQIHQIQKLKLKRSKQNNIVVMCRHCKSILHESSVDTNLSFVDQRAATIKETLVNQFKNAKVSFLTGNILISCNICQQEIGQINQSSRTIALRKNSIMPAVFEWRKRNNCREETVSVGCYSGVSLANLQKMIARIVYMKCRRYQQTIERLEKNMKETLKGFANFILLINIYKAEGDTESMAQQFPISKERYKHPKYFSKKDSVVRQTDSTLGDSQGCEQQSKLELKGKDSQNRCGSSLIVGWVQGEANQRLPSIKEQQD